MVQREIADRLRAAPGSRTYGAPSVLVQLACEVALLRKVDPAVFKPRPRVDSALLSLERHGHGGARTGGCKDRPQRVQGIGASRSPARSSWPAFRGWRRRAGRAPGQARARQRTRAPSSSSPQQFVALADILSRPGGPRKRSLEADGVFVIRAPGQAQPVPVPRAASRGRPARATFRCSARSRPLRPDRRLGCRRRCRRGRLPRRRGAEPGGTWRWRPFARAAGERGRLRSRSTSGSRSPPAWEAAALTRPRCCDWPGRGCPPTNDKSVSEVRRGVSPSRPSPRWPRRSGLTSRPRSSPRLRSSSGAGERVERRPDTGRVRRGTDSLRTRPGNRRASTRRRTGWGWARPGRARRLAEPAASRDRRAAAHRSTTPICSSTTSRASRGVAAARDRRGPGRSSRRPGRRARAGRGLRADGLRAVRGRRRAPTRRPARCRPGSPTPSSPRRSGGYSGEPL